MSGILDNKTRIIDVILTTEGKRQLAFGDMRIEHVSFTDAGTYYSADLVSGSSDATSRIFFEACNLPQDQITFESNDAGRLNPFKNSEGIQISDGQIISYSYSSLTSSIVTGSIDNFTILKGDEFSSTADTLLNSSLNNYQNLQLLSTYDKIFEDDGFGVGQKSIKFTINNTRPISDSAKFSAHIDYLESLFNDVRLSNVDNFKFLPPINKTVNSTIDKTDYSQTSKRHLGNYKPLGRTKTLTHKQLSYELSYYENLGYCKTIKIDPTSRENNLVLQFFEKSYSQLKKLDVIDFGSLRTNNSLNPLAHVFFIGKILVDSKNTNTFIHIFTLVFE